MTIRRRQTDWCSLSYIFGLEVSTLLEGQFDNGLIPVHRHDANGRLASLIFTLEASSFLHEKLDEGIVSSRRREVDRRATNIIP